MRPGGVKADVLYGAGVKACNHERAADGSLPPPPGSLGGRTGLSGMKRDAARPAC